MLLLLNKAIVQEWLVTIVTSIKKWCDIFEGESQNILFFKLVIAILHVQYGSTYLNEGIIL